MSQNVTVAQVQQYKANVEQLLQQMDSRLMPCVDVKSDYFGKGAKAIEQVGAVEAAERTVRHGDVTPVNTPHDARWIFPRDYDVTDYVDDQDKLRMLIDPASIYAKNFQSAHKRKIDRVILDAIFGTSYTGENGTTSTTWAAFVAANASHQIAAGGLGMTVAKLIQAKTALRAEEVEDDDPLFCALTAAEEADLMSEIQVINLDYNDRPVLVEGKLTKFLGFNFVHTELLPLSGSDRRCPVWAKSGLHLGIWQDVYTSIDRIPTKGKTWQVYTCATYGATRTQEKKIVEILAA